MERNRHPLRSVAVTLLLALAGGVVLADDSSADNYGRGPLPIKDNYLLSQHALHFTPDNARIVDEGHWQAEGYFNWSNSFGTRHRPRFMDVDGEIVEFLGSLNYGLNDWFEVGIDVPILWRTGGAMDSLIEGFHSGTGYANTERAGFPRNDFQATITGDRGQVFSTHDTGVDLGNISFKGRANLTDGGDLLPAITLGLDVSLPTSTGDELSGGDGVDVEMSAYLSKHLVGDFYLHVNGGATVLGDDTLGNIQMHSVVGDFGFAVEWACSKATSIVLQGLYQSAQFEEGPGNLPRFSFHYSLGVKTEPWKNIELHLGLIENELKYDNSADFGIQVGASVGF